jgi:hypothetical protein
MSYLPPEPKPKHDPRKPTPTRIALWVLVGGVGVYSIVQGVVGLLQK